MENRFPQNLNLSEKIENTAESVFNDVLIQIESPPMVGDSVILDNYKAIHYYKTRKANIKTLAYLFSEELQEILIKLRQSENTKDIVNELKQAHRINKIQTDKISILENLVKMYKKGIVAALIIILLLLLKINGTFS